MRNSAVENPKFLAAMMSDFFGWRNGKPVRTYAAAAAIPGAGKGEYLFNTRCAACHGIGKGDGLGPDLLNVTTLRERVWLARYLAEPDRMLAEGDPLAIALYARYKNVRMPNLGLNSEEVGALLSHIEQRSRALLEQAEKVPASAR
jgi:protein SCO1/2